MSDVLIPYQGHVYRVYTWVCAVVLSVCNRARKRRFLTSIVSVWPAAPNNPEPPNIMTNSQQEKNGQRNEDGDVTVSDCVTLQAPLTRSIDERRFFLEARSP